VSAAPASLRLGAAERARLRAAADELGVELDATALDRLVRYVDLLDRWRSSANLISCRSAEDLIERHLLDALVCVWPCAAANAVADLGSGAGLPGVPLAIVAPERRTLLIEPRRRRASFLREVKRELDLQHVQIVPVRAEEFTHVDVEPVDVAVSRAVWSDDRMLHFAAPWIRAGGLLLCPRSRSHVRAAAPPFILEQTPDYHLSFRTHRRLDVYRKPATDCFT
jgi:16S rRNA (guanine(527)-N(7))-methyltransferase RsmG